MDTVHTHINHLRKFPVTRFPLSGCFEIEEFSYQKNPATNIVKKVATGKTFKVFGRLLPANKEEVELVGLDIARVSAMMKTDKSIQLDIKTHIVAYGDKKYQIVKSRFGVIRATYYLEEV